MIRRLLVVGLILLAGQRIGVAQEKPTFVLNTEVKAGCLTRPAGASLDFPAEVSNPVGGVVRVRMRFPDAESPPQAEVFTDTAGPAYAAAVLAHVRTYRYGCGSELRSTTSLNQEFQFVVRDGRKIVSSAVRMYRRIPPCKVTMPDPPAHPRDWVGSASPDRVPNSGNAVIGVYFTAPDAPPVVRVLYDGGSRHYARTAEPHAAGIRMHCDSADAFPIMTVVPYRFRFTDVPEFRAATITLSDFLGVVDELESIKVRFDFNTMKCPFEFVLFPLRPRYSNVAHMDGQSSEDRNEFYNWLTLVKLKLPDKLLNDLRGHPLRVQVPCAVMNFL